MATIEKFQQELLDAIQIIEDRIYELSDGYSIEFVFTGVTDDGEPDVDVVLKRRMLINGGYQDVELDSDVGFSGFGEALKTVAGMADGYAET